jgi:Xaa-Pro aminopeptidase
MDGLFKNIDSILLKNFQDYWNDPLINKYFNDDIIKEIEGFLILYKNKKPIWLSHPFNYTQVKKKYSNRLVIKKFSNQKDLEKKLDSLLGKKVGYNGKFYSATGLNTLKKMFIKKKFFDISKELEKDREIKNVVEIKNIKKAVTETKKVLLLTKKWLKKGMSEIQLKKMILEKFEKDGFDTAFCIVAFGKNTSNIHHISGETKFLEGAVMIDVGAKYNGYCADITQSWFVENKKCVSKEYSKNMQKIITTIIEIEKLLKPKTKLYELAKISNKLKIPHSIGHGVGLEIHDFPSGINENSNLELKEGMVLAIEPAIYNKKFGIRIENNYLITKTGFKKL